MCEHFLQSEDGSSVGTVKEVLGAILAKVPGSEREEVRMIAVRIDGKHAADVYAYGVEDDDEADAAIDSPAIASSPVAAFNIVGDDDSVIVDFLVEKFGVIELDM